MYEALTSELKQKLKSGQEINQNLSNIVVHLEGQLSKYQNNVDISQEGEKGSDKLGSGKKSDESEQTKTIQNQILQKKKEYDDLFSAPEKAAEG